MQGEFSVRRQNIRLHRVIPQILKSIGTIGIISAERHQTILSKETLINKIWGYDSDAGDNNVEAYISFLRRKLNALKSKVSITVVRKVGYHLEVAGE